MASNDQPVEQKSKSQQRREALALQKLGAELLELDSQALARLPLSDALSEAVAAARQMKHHGARRRQLRYIGKLLRLQDTLPLVDAMNERRQDTRREAERFKRIERWRDRLLQEGDHALTELLESFPSADVTQLRQLMRNARKAQAAGKPPTAARALFRFLRELMAGE